MLLEALLTNDVSLLSRFLLSWVPMIIIAIAFHEAGHAYSAYYLGDRTAYAQGRCTLNPVSHFDPIGFCMVMLGPLGWGKPVPVNPYHFRHPYRDMMLCAAAGPGVNIILALFSAIGASSVRAAFPQAFVVRYGTVMLPSSEEALWPWLLFTFFQAGITLNLGLAFFNLIPLFPLDGEKILTFFLPRHAREQLEALRPMGPTILMMLILLSWSMPGQYNVLWSAISTMAWPVSMLLTGNSLMDNYTIFFILLRDT